MANLPPGEGGKSRAFEQVAALAFDPAGRRLAVSHSDRDEQHAELTVLDREPGGKSLEIRIRIETAYGLLAFNANGTRLACTGGFDRDPIVEVFDAKTGAELHNFQPPHTITHAVLFLPDERIVVANGRNVCVAKECDTQFTLTGHKGQVNALALAPDGKRILSASHDGAIRVWDAATGEEGPAFDWGIGPVTALSFAPDGLTAAAAGLNGKVVVWDVDG
jgi:WD40 repeat protein